MKIFNYFAGPKKSRERNLDGKRKHLMSHLFSLYRIMTAQIHIQQFGIPNYNRKRDNSIFRLTEL